MALTKVTGGVVSPTSDYAINNVTGVAATFTGNVSIGGTLTYQDVSNIDAVGIVTTQAGIHFGIGATVGKVDTATGIATFSTSVGIADSIFHVGNTDTSIRFPADDTFTVETAGTERLRIHENGAISAGVDNDSYELTLQGKSGGAPTLWLRDGTTTGNPRIIFGDTGAATRSAIYHKNNDDSLNFYTNGEVTVGDARLTIASAGKVGIGSENPEARLHVSDGHLASANDFDSNIVLAISKNTTTSSWAGLAINSGNAAGSFIHFGDTDDSNVGRLDYDHTANSFKFFTNGSGGETLRINSGGQVLVGTDTNPAYTNRRFTVADSTNSGTCALEIRGSASGTSRLYFTSSTTSGQTGAYAGKVLYDHANNYMAFHTNGSNERVRILSDGKVGIGITNPAEKFQVNGGNIAITGGTAYKIDTHPLVSYASFVLGGGNYAARLGSTGTSTIRHTQIYGGGSHIATFDGVNKRLGIGLTNPGAVVHAYHATSNTIAQFESGDAGAVVVLKDNATYSSVEQNGNDFIIHADPGATRAGSALSFKIDGNERLRITNAGFVTINSSSYEALKITTTENGNNGPEVQLIHNSASPAANDCIGQLRFSGKDSAGNTDLMSRIETIIDDPTSGQETAHLNFATRGYAAFNTILRLKARGTASAPSYTTDDMNGIILDTYNTGNPYPRYFNFIAKSAGNTDSNIGFWTESVGGSPTEKMRVRDTGQVEFKNGSFSDNVDCIMGNGGQLTLGGATSIKFRTATNSVLDINSSGHITPGSNSQNFGDGTTNFASIWASTRFRGNDNVKLVLGNSQNLVIRHDGSNNIIGSPVADDLHIKSGTGDNDNQLIASFKHSNASVGIGTDNPAGKLEIDAASTTDMIMLDVAGTNFAKIGHNSSSGVAVLDVRSEGHIRFLTGGNNERLRITNDGPHLLLGGTSDVNEITESSSNAGMVIGGTGFGNGGIAIINSTSGTGRIYFGDAVTNNAARNRGQINYYHNGDYMMFATSGSERLRITSTGSLQNKGTGVIIEQVETNPYNSSWTAAAGKIALKGDLSGGNYFGWRQKGVASGSVTQANAQKKLPTLNDFTYPNSSNGMLIASTSKIGFSASGESPQYATGVRMLFDGDLGLGGSNAYDCNDSVATSTSTQLIMRGNGRIGFHMNGSAPAQAIHIEGGSQTSNRGIYGDWDYGSSTAGQSGANYMLLEDKRWRINRGNPLIHLNAYNNSQNSNGSGGYTSRVMKIDMNTAYTNEVSNDTMYGIDINVNTSNVSQVRALHTNGSVDAVQLYLNDYHMAERYGSDSGSKEWGHWRGCFGGNYGWNGDNRSPKPHDFARGRGTACLFTQKNGNTSGNYMDALHICSYSDWSGGDPNLFMINKQNNNVRIIRGDWDSASDLGSSTYNNYSIYDLDYTSGSDLRLKEDINTITSNTALSLVTQLRPVTFKWKDEYINSGFSKNEKENEYTEEEPLTEGGPKRQIRKPLSSSDKVVNVGLIAQEVESVIPTVVHDGHVGLKDEDGANYKNIDYDKLVPYLIGAIKELKSENDALKARVSTLESS